MKTARILVPPGIGDGYWVLVKLRGFLEAHGIERAQVFVHDAGPRRSGGMWERVPFVDFGGYAIVERGTPELDLAYRRDGHAVQEQACGFDYMLSLNGSLDHGRTLDEALPGPTNWYEPLSQPEVTEHHAATFRARFGDFVLASFWDHGFYRHWVKQFPESSIVRTLRQLADAGQTVVIMGAEWDRGSIGERVARADRRFVSLVGETDFDQLTGLLAGARAVLGFPAGNTLLGPYFRTPTVLLWNRHFPRAFWRSACPPDPRAYQPIETSQTAKKVADAVLSMLAVAA